jgi:hypothetical protein
MPFQFDLVHAYNFVGKDLPSLGPEARSATGQGKQQQDGKPDGFHPAIAPGNFRYGDLFIHTAPPDLIS